MSTTLTITLHERQWDDLIDLLSQSIDTTAAQAFDADTHDADHEILLELVQLRREARSAIEEAVTLGYQEGQDEARMAAY